MNAPSRGAATSPSLLEVNWDTLTSPQNGDSAITSYSLEWDSATSGVSWNPLVGYVSNYVAGNISGFLL